MTTAYTPKLDMFPENFKVPVVCALSFLSIAGILGNALTILCFFRDRELRKRMYDFFICNLAVSDLLICCISIPLYIVYTLQGTWIHGDGACKFWLIIDFALCLQTSICMLTLSTDRLLMVALGPRYRVKVTMKRAKIVSLISWIISFMCYSPSIIWWDMWVGKSVVNETDCYPEFSLNSYFMSITALVDFVLPLVALIMINSVVYYKIWTSNKPDSLRSLGRIHEPHQNISSVEVVVSRASESLKNTNDNCNGRHTTKTKNMYPAVPRKTTTSILRRRYQGNIKAFKHLLSLVFVFFICWCPYSIASSIIALWGKDAIKSVMYQIFYLLVWLKSPVNPLLYSCNSLRYRANFKWVFNHLWNSLKHRPSNAIRK